MADRSSQRGRRRIYVRPAGDSDADWEVFVEQFIAQVDALIASNEGEQTDVPVDGGRPVADSHDDVGPADD
jgi:hypothetical protein